MSLFGSLKETLSPKPVRSLTEIVHERILTAEGWRRRMAPKTKKPK